MISFIQAAANRTDHRRFSIVTLLAALSIDETTRCSKTTTNNPS